MISIDGRSAQWTGSGQKGAESRGDWTAEAFGPTFAVQGNSLVGPEVVEAVAAAFQASDGSPRHLADRLIEALHAGHVLGGDGRHGETQSAAVVVADPRPGLSRRPDGQTVNINVCEHPEPVRELRRIYNTISQTLGFRTVQQFVGNDVWQLKVMLHAAGYFRPGAAPLTQDSTATHYTPEAVAAVDAFRTAERLAGPALGSPPGLVDGETVERLWAALERAGKARQVRERLLDIVAVRR